MTLNLWLLIVATLAVTFANGANDNFKGVATLFGSGTANYRRAIIWATATTMAGSLLALVLASSLMARFSGRGLVPDTLTADPTFLTAVGGGAAVTVLLATFGGFPISTTHALTGGLVGAGVLAADGQLQLSALGTGFVAPLLLSPIAGAILMSVMYGAFSALRRHGARAQTSTARATASALLDGGHYLSAGAVGFARGVNDTPKLAALLLPIEAVLPSGASIPLLAVAMAIGGVLAARRVAETMSHRVTTMTPGQGFLANATTAVLVLFASRFGLPVSTTHVSTGSLFGLGAVISGGAQWRVIIQIVLAWVVTLPCAALCAALLWWLVH